MTRQVLKQLTPIPLVVWGVATIVFVILRIVPGSAVDSIVGVYGTPELREQTREALGLDESIATQYSLFITDAAHLDFGTSFYTGRAVTALLRDTIPVTIELAAVAALIMIVWGVGAGALAAVMRGRWQDSALRGVTAVFFSMPWFFSGILLLVLFTSIWPVLPSFGRLPPTATYDPITNFVLVDAVIERRFDLVWPWLQHIILPAAAIGLTTGGFVARVTRASFLDTLESDHVRTAESKGMSSWQLHRRHVLRNASLPIVAIVGLQTGALLGGAVVAEIVFSYPGVGKLLVDSINRRDYPVVVAASLAIATAYVIVNAITEIVYSLLDPRLRV